MFKSPFLIIDNFISPLQCEDLIDELSWNNPNKTIDDYPLKMVKTDDFCENFIDEKLENVIPAVEKYFNVEIIQTQDIQFEWYPEKYTLLKQPERLRFQSENSVYVRSKWTKVKDNDFSAILFLNDFNEKPPFDDCYEVYGGKLEFFNFKFGFNPKRGMLVVFPSAPNFLNSTSDIFFGDLHQVRIHLKASKPFNFKLSDFPGNYNNWFK